MKFRQLSVLRVPFVVAVFILLSTQLGFVPRADQSAGVLEPEALEIGPPLPYLPSTPEEVSLPAEIFPLALDERLTSQIDGLLERQPEARWGVEVISLDRREIIYEKSGGERFTPASNTKLFTTVTALQVLGPEFRFKTRLGYEGTFDPETGVLEGSLVIRGQGDPDLAGRLEKSSNVYAHLDRMVQAAQEAGIKVIRGPVIGDDSYFEYAPYGEGWLLSDLYYPYAAPVSALSFNDNLLKVWAKPSRRGRPAAVYMEPWNGSIQVANTTRTGASGSPNSIGHSRMLSESSLRFTGSLPQNIKRWSSQLPIEDPALFTAQVLRDRLARKGIRVEGRAESRHFPGTEALTDLHIHESLPLEEIVKIINKKSKNLYAEILLRTLGIEVRNLGSDRAGLAVIEDHLRELGIDRSQADLYDGSGLSRLNEVTPHSQTMLLSQMARTAQFERFKESLAVAGHDGTLAYRMRQSSIAGRVFAKTGTLRDAIALGGYVETHKGELLAFSIFVNDQQFSSQSARRLIDQVCSVLVRS